MIVFRSPRDIGRTIATVIITALALVTASLTTQAALAHANVGDQSVSVVDRSSLPTEQVRTSDSAVAADIDFPVNPPSGCSGYWTQERFGKTGKFACSASIRGVRWPDGHYEYFGIGTNFQVYRISQSSNGWRSMGGTATDTWQAYINGNGYPTIAVFNINAAHKIWCKQYISPSWRGWYACGGF